MPTQFFIPFEGNFLELFPAGIHDLLVEDRQCAFPTQHLAKQVARLAEIAHGARDGHKNEKTLRRHS
jgi:hypothetical protein